MNLKFCRGILKVKISMTKIVSRLTRASGLNARRKRSNPGIDKRFP